MTPDYDQLAFAARRPGSDSRRQHARSVGAGREVRIARGAYVSADCWSSLSATGRHLAQVVAFSKLHHPSNVISHLSAAIVHGLPILPGGIPDAVHATDRRGTVNRRGPGHIIHSSSLADEDIANVDGLPVTSIARTVLDIAATRPFREAVTVADGAMTSNRFHHPITRASRADLTEAWRRYAPFRGHAKAANVIAFAECGAESPLESVSRVAMYELGFPRPLLQSSIFDDEGRIGIVDFSWPKYGVVAEADGALKYLDERFRGGRSADQVVLDEKDREDRLRAASRGFARWRWEVAKDPSHLRRRLERAGLPHGRPRHWLNDSGESTR